MPEVLSNEGFGNRARRIEAKCGGVFFPYAEQIGDEGNNAMFSNTNWN